MLREAGRGGWARWRATVRLARRQARRSPASSTLIVLLIALPVAGLVTAATLATSTIPTAEQFLEAELGQTKTRIGIVSGPDPSLRQSPVDPEWWSVDRDPDTADPVNEPQEPIEDATGLLPPGTTALRIQAATVFARTAAGVGAMSAIVGPAGDAAFAGRYDVVEGRAPANAREALVTRSALESIGTRVGGELELQNPARTFTITGIIDVVDRPDATRTVVLPAAEAGELIGEPEWYLPDTALTWEQIQALNRQGVTALSRPVALDPPVTGTDVDAATLVTSEATIGSILIVGSLVAAFVAYQIVLLAGAAFSVSARRQQRALAMAASVGATRRDLRRMVAMQGLVLSGLGAALGVALGLGAAWAAMRLLDDGNRTWFWAYAPMPWLIAAIVALAVAVGTAAALLPARAAAKVDVLSTLRGARPQRVKRSRPVWGLVIIVVGLGVSVASVAGIVWTREAVISPDDIRAILPMVGVFAGPVLTQAGVIVSGHWLLTVLTRPLSRLGIAPRLAIRDAAANGTRSAAAIGSIGAAVMLATFIASMLSLSVGSQAHDYTPSSPLGTLFVDVYGSGEELPGPERVDRAAGVIQAQSPTGVGVLRMPLSEYQLSENERADADITLPLPREPFRCQADENGSIDSEDPCRSRLDLLRGLYVTTAESLPVLLGSEPSPDALRTFRAGGALVFDEELLTMEGGARIGFWNAQDASEDGGALVWRQGDGLGMGKGAVWELSDPDRSEALDAVLVDTPDRYRYTTLISEQTAAALGIETGAVSLVGAFEEPADERLVERINAAAGIDAGVDARAMTGPPTPVLEVLLVLAATGILMLGTSTIVLGLARIDGRADDATLAAVGATPRLRRGISFWQGLIIALLGSLTGAAAGLLPVWGLLAQSQYLYAQDIPWWAIAAIAVALPLLVATVNAVTSRRRPVLTRRTAIA